MTQDKSTRLFAMDSAKGIGILLVVFGHAWRGAYGAGLLPNTKVFEVVDTAIYAFHMPLFFFLAGLLFLETLRKYPPAKLLRGRVTRLLWPMALWSWVFFALKLGAGQAANTPVTMADFPLVPLPPYEHLWFLWALFLCQTVVIILYRVVGARLPKNVLINGLGGTAIIMALLNPLTPVPSMIWGPMVEHMPYFLAGIAMGGAATGVIRPVASIGSALVSAAVIVCFFIGPPPVIISLALVLMMWQAWLCVDRNVVVVGPLLHTLRFLGQASMVIYLTHTVFSAALRIVMLRFDFSEPSLVVVLTTLVGAVVPLGVLSVAQRLRATKLLGF